jgi:hypothetical protein
MAGPTTGTTRLTSTTTRIHVTLACPIAWYCQSGRLAQSIRATIMKTKLARKTRKSAT